MIRFALVALMITAPSACGTLDVTSDADSPLGRTVLISAGIGLALSFGTLELITGDRSPVGHALEHRREVAIAIARGKGPFVTDLAAWLQLPASLVPKLGEVLRRARDVLGEALAEPIAVETFEILLGVALCGDPTLRYHAWKRFECERLVPMRTLALPSGD